MSKKNIKFLILDVDGTLTDGKIYMGNEGEVLKACDIKDGCGIHDILIPSGIVPIIITGRVSEIVKNRCKELGITVIHQGVKNKIEKLDEVLKEFSDIFFENNNKYVRYEYKHCAYCGDDINDLSCMEPIKNSGGLIGCPSDAVKQVKEISDFISNYKGGNGAVREFIEWILEY